jgi:hypothetical protein
VSFFKGGQKLWAYVGSFYAYVGASLARRKFFPVGWKFFLEKLPSGQVVKLKSGKLSPIRTSAAFLYTCHRDSR